MIFNLVAIRNAFVSGLNHSLDLKDRHRAAPPAHLDENIDAGLKFLSHIGTGPQAISLGRMHLLASSRGLLADPSVEDVERFVRGKGRDAAVLLYALHHGVALAEAGSALGVLTLFDDDAKIAQLYLFGISRQQVVTEVSRDVIDFTTGANVTALARDIADVVVLINEKRGLIRSIPNSEGSTKRAQMVLVIFLELLDNPLMQRVLNSDRFFPEILGRHEGILNADIVEAYEECLKALKGELGNIIEDFLIAGLPTRIADGLNEASMAAVQRALWKACLGDSVLRSNPLLQSMRLASVSREESSREILASSGAFAKGLVQSSFSIQNLWGLGWNPLGWISLIYDKIVS